MAAEGTKQRARDLRRAGLSVAQIAEEMGLRSHSMIWRWVADLPVPEWTKRPQAKDDLRARARELREQGANYAQIVSILGVSKSSVSLWVRDLPHPERTPEAEAARLAGLRRAAAERRSRVAEERETFVASVAAKIGCLSDRERLIAGAVAYWAEGTKSKPWRVSEEVAFINSDVDMIRLFLAFLSQLGISKDRVRFRVSIHESADEYQARAFWSGVVGVQPEDFQRSTLKRHSVATVRKNRGDHYHGCLIVRVKGSAALYREIEGIWRAVGWSSSSL